MIKYNPTEDIDVSFNSYVSSRQRVYTTHLEGGIPDYAFACDYTLRQKIKAMPGIYPFFKALTSTYVPRQKQQINMSGLRVGADQIFPYDIHRTFLSRADKEMSHRLR